MLQHDLFVTVVAALREAIELLVSRVAPCRAPKVRNPMAHQIFNLRAGNEGDVAREAVGRQNWRAVTYATRIMFGNDGFSASHGLRFLARVLGGVVSDRYRQLSSMRKAG